MIMGQEAQEALEHGAVVEVDATLEPQEQQALVTSLERMERLDLVEQEALVEAILCLQV